MTLAPVLGLTALLNLYIALRLLPSLPGPVSSSLLGLALATLSLTSPLGLAARRLARPPVADRLAWAGMLALGLFSSLFVFTLLRDLMLLLAALAAWIEPGLAAPGLAALSAEAVPLLALLASLLGAFNARRTAQVVEVDVPIVGLPAALHGFTIAQISDIHVGPTIKAPYLQGIVDAVNRLQADMVAITGDLVDGSVKELADHVAPLAGLSSRHGSFFVTGNHEYYSGAHSWIDALRALGIQVLVNEHVVIQHSTDAQDPEPALVVVAGVADYGAHHFDEAHRSDPHKAMANAPEHAVFKLLLAHQPRSAAAAADAGFDLQLSGHTHGGQFWPWNLFVPLQQPFTAGLHRLQTLWVYTSRGTGYWGPPKRFGAPSEITYLRLVRA